MFTFKPSMFLRMPCLLFSEIDILSKRNRPNDAERGGITVTTAHDTETPKSHAWNVTFDSATGTPDSHDVTPHAELEGDANSALSDALSRVVIHGPRTSVNLLISWSEAE